MILTQPPAFSEADNSRSDRNKAVYSCLFADLVPLGGSSGYHKRANKLFLKTMRSNAELLGTNPEEELEYRARRTVSYVAMSISSFPSCAVELRDMDGGNIVESNAKERRESGLTTRITRKKKNFTMRSFAPFDKANSPPESKTIHH